jgi:hypothetical protein
MAFCQADLRRKVLGEDASMSQSFYADYERDIGGQWLFKIRAEGTIATLRLTEQEFDESSGRVSFAFRGGLFNGTCRRYTGQQLTTQAAYEPSRVRDRTGAGSYWNYEFADAITGKRSVLESIMTETNVIRFNTRGLDNIMIVEFGPAWSIARAGNTRYTPAQHWMPGEFRVGARASWEGQQTTLGPQGWSNPKPQKCESQITGREMLTTKAGRFDTYRVEVNCHRFPSVGATQAENHEHYIRWYAPGIDHWVKQEWEMRSNDDRLAKKTSISLIEYKLR